ncbi:MAG: dihydroneopterin aldolase [Alphaproteobacteria bacterium]|nr:dihydroneopterin aldolase [Alphaproteobacteria bacterium]
MTDHRTTKTTHRPIVLADAGRKLRHVFVRDLELGAKIGVHTSERVSTQPIRINVDLAVHEDDAPLRDELADVVCYEDIVNAIKGLLAQGHVNLVETLAERIAARCLVDPRVYSARIRIEKLRVIAEAASVGVEIERRRPKLAASVRP